MIGREIFDEIFEKTQTFDGSFTERLVYFMINFSGAIEKGSLKLCQEWVRNTVNPDLVEDEFDRNKLNTDICYVQKLFEKAMENGELKKDTPADQLAHTLIDLLYGEMLCWDMSGGKYSLEERTKEFCAAFLPSLLNPYMIRKDV